MSEIKEEDILLADENQLKTDRKDDEDMKQGSADTKKRKINAKKSQQQRNLIYQNASELLSGNPMQKMSREDRKLLQIMKQIEAQERKENGSNGRFSKKKLKTERNGDFECADNMSTQQGL